MSFLSVEPPSRVVLESHSHRLLVQFDTQIGITNRYLDFFQERRRIEATYIDSLRELHRKAKNVDASFEPRRGAEPTTTRAAWEKVRDSLEGEADSQQAFLDILDNDVITPLTKLKESEYKSKERVEYDLQEGDRTYAHFSDKTIKLQQAYLKKYYPQQYALSTEVSQRPQDIPDKWYGGKVSALLRGWIWQENLWEPEYSKSEEVSDDECREAVCTLNTLRAARADTVEDGYDCLEELVLTPVVKNVLVKYMDCMTTACARYDNLAMSTREEVEQALAGTDVPDLRATLRRALSFSIPPVILYRNDRPGAYSELIFGLPLMDAEKSDGNVPKVMRMCIEEIEKRGLNSHNIYSARSTDDAEVLQLRRRFESETTFSFSSTDDIHLIANLLMLYLGDLPQQPLLMLPLRYHRTYIQNRASYAENDFLLLRSKIRELHPLHKATLEALLRHLSCVASHSDNNGMTVKELGAQFCYVVLGGNAVFEYHLEGNVNVKALVVEDLIRNAHTLFDERHSPSPPVPSSDVSETTSTFAYGSALSLESPRSAGAQAVGSTTGHLSTHTQSSFSASPSDFLVQRPLTPTDPLATPPAVVKRKKKKNKEQKLGLIVSS